MICSMPLILQMKKWLPGESRCQKSGENSGFHAPQVHSPPHLAMEKDLNLTCTSELVFSLIWLENEMMKKKSHLENTWVLYQAPYNNIKALQFLYCYIIQEVPLFIHMVPIEQKELMELGHKHMYAQVLAPPLSS